MTGNEAPRVRGGPSPASPAPFTTLVELTWVEKKIEHWIRFGRQSYDQILDRRRRVVGLSAAEQAAAAEQGREQRRRFLTPGTGYQPGNAQMFNSGN